MPIQQVESRSYADHLADDPQVWNCASDIVNWPKDEREISSKSFSYSGTLPNVLNDSLGSHAAVSSWHHI
jgi:hypothetical protein